MSNARIRSRLWEAQGGRCYLCGEELNGFHINFDHVVPKRRGGHDDYNRLLAHAPCNTMKGHTRPTVEQKMYCLEVYIWIIDNSERHRSRANFTPLPDMSRALSTWRHRLHRKWKERALSRAA